MFSKSESEHLYFKGVWLSCKLPFGYKCSHLFNCTLPITILNILAFIKRKMQCSNPEITLFRAAETLSVWKRVPAVYLLQTQDVRNRLKSVSLGTCYCWVFVQLGFFLSVCPCCGIAHLRYFWMIRLSVWCHHKCTLSALQMRWGFCPLNTASVRQINPVWMRSIQPE